MTEAVLDASAILALVRREAGAEIVEAILDRDTCCVSAVNIAEVVGILADWAVPFERIEAAVRGFQLEVYDFSFGSALAMADIRARTRPAGLSLADRACIELGERLGLPLVTTDRVWKTLDLRVPVMLARPE